MKSCWMPKLLPTAGIACMLVLIELSAFAQNKINWPTEVVSLTSNRPPIVVDGVPQEFLGTTFHIEAFDPATTILSGYIETTNCSDHAQSVRFWLVHGVISGHIIMRDMYDRNVLDPNGAFHNWNVVDVSFAAHEVKRLPFKDRLRNCFDLRQGTYQLLFVFNERLLRNIAGDRFTACAWSKKRILLRCE
jgi:hypothetical protein